MYAVYEIGCNGKVYEIDNTKLDNLERNLENAEDGIRERCATWVEERFEQLCDETEERTREANEGLRGAALNSAIKKALKDLRKELEEEADKTAKKELEDYREHLLRNITQEADR